MANNRKSSYADEENIGKIQISEQVVAVIAGIAATEVEGVYSLVGNITNEIISKMGIKNLSKGVKANIFEDTVTVNVTLDIKYGFNVPDICKAVQSKVASAIETMTGLKVVEVNVVVADVTIA
ncbi:MAG: Asp23/Gls24 family envelope stress response protein [Butyrivibrio sp.]